MSSANPYDDDDDMVGNERDYFSSGLNQGGNQVPLTSSTWEDDFRQLPPEGERLQQWRAEQPQRIEEKRRTEENKRTEIRESASSYIQQFFQKREEEIARKKEENRAKDNECYKYQFLDKEDELEPTEAFEYSLQGKGARLSARTESVFDTSSGKTRTQKELKRMRESMQNYKEKVASAH
eukprot:jgi/Galph1/5763/GphlegSOOS_G4336.1